MLKKSALFNLYSDRLARCKSPDELMEIAQEMTAVHFPAHERAALALSCMYIAKRFDKEDKKLRKALANEDFSMVRCSEE